MSIARWNLKEAVSKSLVRRTEITYKARLREISWQNKSFLSNVMLFQEYHNKYPSHGKWVRYDKDGHMVKGWSTDKNGTYYFDVATGAMVKGYVEIDGKTYYFDKVTGIQQPNGWNYERYNGSYYYFWYEDGVRQGYKVKEDGSIDESYRGKEIYDPESKAWYWFAHWSRLYSYC